jgi:hypothetical protein
LDPSSGFGAKIEQDPTVEAERAGTDEDLLGVIGRAWWIEVCAGHVLGVAAGYRRRQAAIDSSQQHRIGGAAD